MLENLVEVLDLQDLSWQDLANCRGADADLWHLSSRDAAMKLTYLIRF